MHTEYHPFWPHRQLTEYRGQPGPHGGQALDANAYAAIFRAREVARGHRSRESLAYRLKEARRETEMARVVILGGVDELTARKDERV